MKIKMVKRMQGSEDGLTIRDFQAEKEYDVCDKLAKVFVDNKWAYEVKAEVKPIEKPVEKVEIKKPVFGDNAYANELKKGARR